MHIILMGAPGCGKGTQAQKIVEEFGFKHLSTGELFRKKYAQRDAATKAGKASIDKGGFFSDEIAYQVITDFIHEHSNAQGIIFDGFPRDINQTKYFLENICATPIVIELKANQEKLINRLLRRGEKDHRIDDSSGDIIHKRMQLYEELTYPAVQFFASKNLLNTYQSEGEIASVAKEIKALIKSKLKE